MKASQIKRQKIDKSRQRNLQKRIERSIARKAAERHEAEEAALPDPLHLQNEILELEVIKDCNVVKKKSFYQVNLLLQPHVNEIRALNAVRTCLIVKFELPLEKRIRFKVAKQSA